MRIARNLSRLPGDWNLLALTAGLWAFMRIV